MPRRSTLGGLSLLLGLIAPLSLSAQLLHVHDSSGRLGTVDIATGDVAVIGMMGDVITDIAFDPLGNLFGLSFATLYRIDPVTAALTAIGAHGIPGGNALVFGTDGTLYAAGGSSGDLFTVDPTTGAATSLGTLGVQSAGDLAFHGGSLYLSTSSNELFDVVLSDPGSSTSAGPFGFVNVFGLATAANGVLYGVSGTDVFSVDTATGEGTLVRSFAGKGLGTLYGTSFFTEARPPVTTVPEPISLLLLGSGLGGIGALRWIRRRREMEVA